MFSIIEAIILAWLLAIILTVTGAISEGEYIAISHYDNQDNAGHVSFTPLVEAPWFRVPYPFQWGIPQLSSSAFCMIITCYIIGIVDSLYCSIYYCF